MTERRKTSVTVWIAIGLVSVLFLYIASFGPAWWVQERLGVNAYVKTFAVVYRPILFLSGNGPAPIRRVIDWYAAAGRKDGAVLVVLSDRDNHMQFVLRVVR
jgi:hypothetical protein